MIPTAVPPAPLPSVTVQDAVSPVARRPAVLVAALAPPMQQVNPAETAASGDTRLAVPGRSRSQLPAPVASQPPVDPSPPPALLAPTRPMPTPGGVSPTALLKTTLAARSPLLAAGGASARPASGLWVLATARCPLPSGLDLNAWADCTQPLGFKGGELAVLEKPRAGNKAELTGGLYSIARTRYRIGALAASGDRAAGPGGLALTQVEVPGIGGRTYVYIALRPEVVDGDGRVVAARAWPVACPGAAASDVTRRGDRCFASTLQAVKAAASAVPLDGGYVLRWIDPTDADAAGDTTGARSYAPPPPPVFRAPRKLTPLEAAQPSPLG